MMSSGKFREGSEKSWNPYTRRPRTGQRSGLPHFLECDVGQNLEVIGRVAAGARAVVQLLHCTFLSSAGSVGLRPTAHRHGRACEAHGLRSLKCPSTPARQSSSIANARGSQPRSPGEWSRRIVQGCAGSPSAVREAGFWKVKTENTSMQAISTRTTAGQKVWSDAAHARARTTTGRAWRKKSRALGIWVRLLCWKAEKNGAPS